MNISSPKDLNKITEKINKIISPGDYIFLFGEIGSGKTTFTRHLVNSLEIKNKLPESEVLSPTFNIVYEYEINNILIKHFDLYRLRSKDELNNLGIFDNTEDIITIIEWPELILKNNEILVSPKDSHAPLLSELNSKVVSGEIKELILAFNSINKNTIEN